MKLNLNSKFISGIFLLFLFVGSLLLSTLIGYIVFGTKANDAAMILSALAISGAIIAALGTIFGKKKCEICGFEFEHEGFKGDACPNCGQNYKMVFNKKEAVK